LAISRELVTMMGGEIGVESTVGAGSTFWFTARFARSRAHSARRSGKERSHDPRMARLYSPSQPVRVGLPQIERDARPRILLAEDNPVNQEVAKDMLEALGYGVDIASDGRQAIEMCARGIYEVVLMDCQMPQINGYDAAKQIRAGTRESKDVPIIAVTARALDGDREKSLDAGMDDYLTKPLTIERLKDVLHRWTNETDRDASSDSEPAGPPTAVVLDANIRRSTKVVRLLLGQLDDLVPRLREMIERGDTARIGEVAHRLKGGFRAAGARRIANVCASLEDDPAYAASRVSELEIECHSLRVELQAELPANVLESEGTS
jgi:CheY-like chemotaxis protein